MRYLRIFDILLREREKIAISYAQGMGKDSARKFFTCRLVLGI